MVSVTRAVFGDLPSGAGTVEKFQLQSDLLKVDIISWGCTITALEVKDRQGRASDVVLGFAELEGYLQKQPYFGAVVGRVANRIAKGTFMVDGKEYKLAVNNGPNSLHGGVRGFDKVVWTPQVLSNGVQFSRISPDGEEGYPGELKVWVTYTLDGGELMVNYRAQASQTTPVNLTNHSYFNLAGQEHNMALLNFFTRILEKVEALLAQFYPEGKAILGAPGWLSRLSIWLLTPAQGSPNIYDHEVTIEADAFLPVDETLIPTGTAFQNGWQLPLCTAMMEEFTCLALFQPRANLQEPRFHWTLNTDQKCMSMWLHSETSPKSFGHLEVPPLCCWACQESTA
ncbi:galactose mutarotase isoform X8 [Acinonyx jubatus]|uniref:Galactose mutarotase n=1 Tax=Acinonyx jubatus TaxID=32536 RepID=A0ABM3NC34_ACIJB|nr:galactose mutarotase isoform X8 [Acinonyx jubatus]